MIITYIATTIIIVLFIVLFIRSFTNLSYIILLINI